MNVPKRRVFFGRMIAAALVSWGALAVSAPVKAQDVEPVTPRMWDVKIGPFFPTQGTYRNQSNSPLYALGADYDPNLRYHLAGGRLSAGIEFRYRQSAGRRYLTVPLSIRNTWDLTPATSKYRIYSGLGVGLYFINTGFRGGTTQPGLKFVVGADLSPTYFLELGYDYVSGFTDNLGNGVRADGLSLYVGRRF